MKFKHILIIPALALGFAAGLCAQPAPASAPAPAAPAAPEAAAPKFTDAQIFEMLGWYVGSNSRVNEFEPTPALIDAFMKGVLASVNGKDAPFEHEAIGPDMERVLMGRQMAYQAKLKAKSDEEAKVYFDGIKKKPGAVALESGVVYEILKEGTGAYPTANDTVKINYKGMLTNGTVFDSSYERKEPAEFPLGGVIPGMTEGLQKVKKGGQIRIYIPASLGYGERAMQNIPAYSTLVFEVELLDILPPPPPAPELPDMPEMPAAPASAPAGN